MKTNGLQWQQFWGIFSSRNICGITLSIWAYVVLTSYLNFKKIWIFSNKIFYSKVEEEEKSLLQKAKKNSGCNQCWAIKQNGKHFCESRDKNCFFGICNEKGFLSYLHILILFTLFHIHTHTHAQTHTHKGCIRTL